MLGSLIPKYRHPGKTGGSSVATHLAIFWWWMGKSMGHKWSGLYPKASNLFWQSVKRKHSNNTTESMSRRHEQVRNVSSLWTGLVPRLPTLEVMVWIKRLRCFKATVPYLYHLDSRWTETVQESPRSSTELPLRQELRIIQTALLFFETTLAMTYPKALKYP